MTRINGRELSRVFASRQAKWHHKCLIIGIRRFSIIFVHEKKGGSGMMMAGPLKPQSENEFIVKPIPQDVVVQP